MKAIWNDIVLAESDDTKVVEGNHYFPPDSIKREYFKASETHSVCPWKGTASYYTLEVNGTQNPDAAWFCRAAQWPALAGFDLVGAVPGVVAGQVEPPRARTEAPGWVRAAEVKPSRVTR